jgi:hypothetical protein
MSLGQNVFLSPLNLVKVFPVFILMISLSPYQSAGIFGFGMPLKWLKIC